MGTLVTPEQFKKAQAQAYNQRGIIRVMELRQEWRKAFPPINPSMAAKGSANRFVQDMTWTSMCRKVFRTAKGHIGLGPRTMKGDDLCVVLLGAVYRMVLRRCGGYFKLVGPALLYGFMNEEAGSLCRDGKLVEVEVELI